MKVWTNTEKGSDKVIAVDDQKLHKGNPKSENFNATLASVNKGNIPPGFLSIPFSYIKQIQWQEGKPYIQVFFGQDSEEYFRVKHDLKRREIFEYLKTTLPNSAYKLEKYTAWRSAKKAIIATIVISILFAVVLDTAIRLEQGTYYGAQLVIVLFFAGLGVRNVVLLFGAFITIGLIAIYRKVTNKPVIHLISRR